MIHIIRIIHVYDDIDLSLSLFEVLQRRLEEGAADRFVISVTTGLSRTTLALAAVNFGVRVLPETWCLDLENSVPWPYQASACKCM